MTIHISKKARSSGWSLLPYSMWLLLAMMGSLRGSDFLGMCELLLPAQRCTFWTHSLDVAGCYSQGPKAKSFVAKSGIVSPCHIPSLIWRACHSLLTASHQGPGQEMRPRNLGTEPPASRELLTHSQCILTQGNSQESQRAVPEFPEAELSALLWAKNKCHCFLLGQETMRALTVSLPLL